MRNSHVSCFLYKSHKKISWDMRFSHETGDRRFSHEGGCTKKCPVSWENLMSQEKISCLKKISHILSFLAPPHEKISYLLSHEKISGPKRKSHVFSVFGPPPQQENLLSPVSWENLMTQEKILCLFSIGSPPNEKISCLLSHEKISCPKRKSHVFSVLAPPQWENLLSQVSWGNLVS